MQDFRIIAYELPYVPVNPGSLAFGFKVVRPDWTPPPPQFGGTVVVPHLHTLKSLKRWLDTQIRQVEQQL